MMNGELLPCPFCGSPAEIDPRPVEWPDWWGCTVWCSAINTHECSAQIIAAGDTEQEAIEAAVTAWNRRYERTCQCTTDDRAWCFACSECGKAFPRWELKRVHDHGEINYCPNCGARVVDE